ncbi:MAG: ABC transporter substrate-binding protein [Promethearchaeota archaeon]
MEMEKKNLAIIILAVVLAASGIGNVILAVGGGLIATSADAKKTAIFAANYPGLAKNDPVDTWDRVSIWHQQEVTEGLVYYDLSKHPNYAPSPKLATNWTWNSPTSITFQIREDVFFHDGTPLTPTAIKWNFDRLMWFSNVSGLVPANDTSKLGFSSSLYYLPNGDYLFDSFVADDVNMQFTINLNGAFGVLLDLLCFISTNIISPASHKFYEIVQLDEILVGTGPWKMKSHSPRREIRYERNGRWWGKTQYFDQIIMKFVDDDTARMNAGLAGQYDYVAGVLKTYIDQFRATSGMHVEDIGEGFVYYYMEIYCGPRDYDGNMIVPGDHQYQRNNATFRRALAYALNYTYIIEEIQQGKAFYGVPAVPRDFPGHNSSVWHGYNESLANGYATSIEIARDLMKTMWPAAAGWDSSYPGTSESQWASNNFMTFELNEHSGGGLATDLTLITQASWRLIGINVVPTVREWGQYLDVGELTPWEMDGGIVGWGPDYLNPYNMIDPLFNLASGSCFSRINDTGLIALMADAVAETDYATQLLKWEKVQSYIYDVRYETGATSAHIPAYVYFVQQVHKDTLMGVQYNLLGDFNWANWYEE